MNRTPELFDEEECEEGYAYPREPIEQSILDAYHEALSNDD